MKPLVYRADAGTRIGTGHVMRCLALAQAWQECGGRAVLVTADLPPNLRERLVAENVSVVNLDAPPGGAADAALTASCAREHEAEWVAIDGYHFAGGYQKAVREAGFQVLALDDYGHAGRQTADLILNQNLHAAAALYADREPHTRLLLGPRYALLRREFVAARDWCRVVAPAGRRVLVTLGGSDPENVTSRVVEALSLVEVEGLEAVVLVGASNPHLEGLRAAVRSCRGDVRLETNASDMPGLMRWADVAVSAGGTTCYELAFLGLPALLLVLADNQRDVTERMAGAGAAVNLGWSTAVTARRIAGELTSLLGDSSRRDELSRRGRSLVDGLGAARVVRQMLAGPLRLRRVRDEDCDRVWKWSNDPSVRAVSFDASSIPWERHLDWFRAKREDPRCLFLMGVEGGEPIGQVRFEADADEAVVSVSLDPAFRGRGFGWRLICSACAEVFDQFSLTRIHAYIKRGNEASMRAFHKAGFLPGEGVMIRGQLADHMILRKMER